MAVTPAPPNPPSPPAATKKGLLRRNLRFFLAANLAVGVYVLFKTSKKEPSEKGEEAAVKMVPAAPVTIEPATPDKEMVVATVTPPTKVLPPITEQEQRELFKWILEEKRKVKPNSPDEKKNIEEEKALLKQLIRAKSIPKIHETHFS